MSGISLDETNAVHKFCSGYKHTSAYTRLMKTGYFGDEMEQRMRQDLSPQSQKASRIPAYAVL